MVDHLILTLVHTLQVTLHLQKWDLLYFTLVHNVHVHMYMCFLWCTMCTTDAHASCNFQIYVYCSRWKPDLRLVSKSGGKVAPRYRKWMQFACGAPCGQTELRKPVLCGVLNGVRKSLLRSELLALNDTSLSCVTVTLSHNTSWLVLGKLVVSLQMVSHW